MVRLPPTNGGAIEGYVDDILAASQLTPGVEVRAATDVRPGYAYAGRCVPVGSPFDRYPLAPAFSILPHAIGGFLVANSVRKEVRAGRVDLLHLNEEVSIRTCARLDVPKIATVHSPAEYLLHSLRAKDSTAPSDTRANLLLRRLDWLVISSALRHYDGVVAPNSATREALLDRGVPAHVVPLPVDVDSFRPAADARRGREVVRLLYVGRLESRKNLGVLLTALRGTPSSVRLVCVGRGPLRDAFAHRAKRLGVWDRCTLVPTCSFPDLVSYFQSSDIFVFPSLIEAYGRVINEALACGLPIVLPDLPVYTDFLDSQAVRTFRASESLDGVLTELVDDPGARMRMGVSGREFAVSRLSYRAFAGRLAAVFQDALGNEPAASASAS